MLSVIPTAGNEGCLRLGGLMSKDCAGLAEPGERYGDFLFCAIALYYNQILSKCRLAAGWIGSIYEFFVARTALDAIPTDSEGIDVSSPGECRLCSSAADRPSYA